MPKINKYGLELQWAPEFPWMFEDTEEKLDYPSSSEVGMVCPTTAQKLGSSGIFLKNHVMVDCRRLVKYECCVQSNLIREINMNTGPDAMDAVIQEALQSRSAVLVTPPQRMSLDMYYKLGCCPKGWTMGLFRRHCQCRTGNCNVETHVANQLYMIDPEGVCLGAGTFIGWFVPLFALPECVRDKTFPWVLYLRKHGEKGAHSKGHGDTFYVDYDFDVEDAYEEVHDNPKGKYSKKAYALLRGYRG
nr:nsp1 [Rabbit coronavirus HKU14]YP_009944254.1 nsp1 [Rabbit coronavirus HKU14]